MYVMNDKLNQIIEAWELGNTKEREEFLIELHKRYGFEKICLALSSVQCGLMQKLSDEEIERRFPVPSKLDILNTY
jgi:hypothetical protein